MERCLPMRVCTLHGQHSLSLPPSLSLSQTTLKTLRFESLILISLFTLSLDWSESLVNHYIRACVYLTKVKREMGVMRKSCSQAVCRGRLFTKWHKEWKFNNAQYHTKPFELHFDIFPLISVDCFWNTWQEWQECSLTCGGGVQYRSRTKEGPQNGGEECVGLSEAERECNTDHCPG